MDGRPQLERTARRALLGALLLVLGSTVIGGAAGLAVAVHLTSPKEKS